MSVKVAACRCRLVEGELPAIVRLFAELSEGSGLCCCTVLICPNTTVLLSLSLWRSAISKLSSQTMANETLSKKQKREFHLYFTFCLVNCSQINSQPHS